MKKNSHIICFFRLFCLFIVFALLMWNGIGCAKKTSIEGGPYDMTPPRLIRATPPVGSVNVTTRKIKLRFDENVRLERQSEKIIFTPPQTTPPKITAGTGKSITIAFQEPLLPSTTYIIDFSDAIVDLNEGNPMNAFSYAFSTGNVIDSLIIEGLVLDAETLRPLPELTVGIYKDFTKEDLGRKPMLRLSKSTSEGRFSISHVADGKYALFAINDIDKSYNYSSPNEGIAFLPELVKPISPVSLSDSIGTKDSLSFSDNINSTHDSVSTMGLSSKDSIIRGNRSSMQSEVSRSDSIHTTSSEQVAVDSVLLESERVHVPQTTQPTPSYLLLYSVAKDYKQALQKAERIDSTKLSLQFLSPIDTLPHLTLLAPDISHPKILAERSDDRKNVIYHLLDSSLYNCDTLRFVASYAIRDSLFHSISKQDTLLFVYHRSTNHDSTEEEYWGIFDFLRPKKKKESLEQISNRTDSIPTDSLSNPVLREFSARILPQPIYKQGHPKQSFVIEFSEPIDSLQLSHLLLYESNEQVSKTEPDTLLQGHSSDIDQAEIRTDSKDPMAGGATNPYESGIDRYASEDEKVSRNDIDTPPSSFKDSREESETNNSRPLMTHSPDSIRKPIKVKFIQDTYNPRRYGIYFTADYGKQYILSQDSVGIVGYYGSVLKREDLHFKTEQKNSFGSVELLIDSLDRSNAYFDLLTTKDSVLLRLPVSDTIHLDEFVAGKYYARIWIDRNANQEWDGGLYPDKLPEPVYYIPQAIEVVSKFTRCLIWSPLEIPLYLQRPVDMFKPELQKKNDQNRERRNLNEEYVRRMRERYGDKWNPSNRDRRILGMPSRQEEKAKQKSIQDTANQNNKSKNAQKNPSEKGEAVDKRSVTDKGDNAHSSIAATQ